MGCVFISTRTQALSLVTYGAEKSGDSVGDVLWHPSADKKEDSVECAHDGQRLLSAQSVGQVASRVAREHDAKHVDASMEANLKKNHQIIIIGEDGNFFRGGAGPQFSPS